MPAKLKRPGVLAHAWALMLAEQDLGAEEMVLVWAPELELATVPAA